MNWLNYMLWGGAILLAFEHVWHGEVTPWFPFLTAMSDPQDASEMFHEMATVGVSMSVLVTGIWAVMCAAADAIFEYAELGAEYFTPAPADMLNDAFLGLSVVALGFVIWLVRLLIADPKGRIRAVLLKKDT